VKSISASLGLKKMTVTIELPPDLAARLEAVGIPSEEAERYALEALSEVADSADVRDWWARLTEAQREAERAATQRSLAAGDAGHSSPGSMCVGRGGSGTGLPMGPKAASCTRAARR
jgi:hypothetical protein